MPDGLTKQQRIIAYRMVDEVLSRPIPAAVERHHLSELPEVEAEEIARRAEHILRNLRGDAKDLWDES